MSTKGKKLKNTCAFFNLPHANKSIDEYHKGGIFKLVFLKKFNGVKDIQGRNLNSLRRSAFRYIALLFPASFYKE